MIINFLAVDLVLDEEVMRGLDIRDVIYAEYSELGAMGSPGRVFFYRTEETKFRCYTTRFSENKEVFDRFVKLLMEYSNASLLPDLEQKDEVFDYCNGGMGNHVFINKHKDLESDMDKECLIYKFDSRDLRVYPSFLGVFQHVVEFLK